MSFTDKDKSRKNLLARHTLPVYPSFDGHTGGGSSIRVKIPPPPYTNINTKATFPDFASAFSSAGACPKRILYIYIINNGCAGTRQRISQNRYAGLYLTPSGKLCCTQRQRLIDNEFRNSL
jgi:hypothetical protein